MQFSDSNERNHRSISTKKNKNKINSITSSNALTFSILKMVNILMIIRKIERLDVKMIILQVKGTK
jgi:hypothetical protein